MAKSSVWDEASDPLKAVEHGDVLRVVLAEIMARRAILPVTEPLAHPAAHPKHAGRCMMSKVVAYLSAAAGFACLVFAFVVAYLD
jgi:hypothetical protein